MQFSLKHKYSVRFRSSNHLVARHFAIFNDSFNYCSFQLLEVKSLKTGIMNLSVMASVLAQRMKSVQVEAQFILNVHCFQLPLTSLGTVEKIPLGLYI